MNKIICTKYKKQDIKLFFLRPPISRNSRFFENEKFIGVYGIFKLRNGQFDEGSVPYFHYDHSWNWLDENKGDRIQCEHMRQLWSHFQTEEIFLRKI